MEWGPVPWEQLFYSSVSVCHLPFFFFFSPLLFPIPSFFVAIVDIVAGGRPHCDGPLRDVFQRRGRRSRGVGPRRPRRPHRRPRR